MGKPVGRMLVSNDDGINAPGIKTTIKIAKALSDDVWVVAPAEEMSGASHSLSLSKPLRMKKLGPRRFAITGTPTDCVMVATRHLMKDKLPDLILSGVNFGQNIAEDVSYSGTVAVAKEGTLLGIPSIAMSQAINFADPIGAYLPKFEVAEKYAPAIIRNLLKLDWQKGTLININFPDVEPNQKPKARITKQGLRDKRILGLEARTEPHGNTYFWYRFERALSTPHKGTDIEAIMQGDISITPLHMDHTSASLTKKLAKLF